jgi:hypothetical protein
MGTTMLAPEFGSDTELMLESTLATAHDRWMAEVHQVLLPVARPDATFWERWDAIRFLAERFPDRLGLERALGTALRPWISSEDAARLECQGARLVELHRECNRLAQERGMARDLAKRTGELLEAVRLWCAEFELAARHITESDVDEEVMRILGRMSLSCTPEWTVAMPAEA